MQGNGRIPIPTLSRFATYYGVLRNAANQGRKYLNSSGIESLCGISASQIRKDLSHIGELGRKGVGYEVNALRIRLAEILKVDRRKQVAIIGAGRLGQALATYPGLADYSFEVAALFDSEPAKIGMRIGKLQVLDAAELPNRLKSMGIRIAVLAVPGSEAQAAADHAFEGGVRWILNFTPAHIKPKSGCMVRDVSFTQEFAVLAHYSED